MDNNFNQTQPTTNYMAGTAPQKPNILMGTIGALIAAVVGTLAWILIATYTGYIIFLLGVGIAFLAMFLYQKLAKGMDIVGIIICTVLTCIAIYLGNRYGNICLLAHEMDCSVGDATDYFDWVYDLSSDVQMEYIKNMVMSYVVGIGYSVVMVTKGLKRK